MEVTAEAIRAAVHNDSKQRMVIRPGEDGELAVAAWSGHTLEGVAGPSVPVDITQVPEILYHGTYRRLVPSIQSKGILAQRRMIHLQDRAETAGRWRADLEVQIEVKTAAAAAAGCGFRKTGNLVWLCAETIPPTALGAVEPWSLSQTADLSREGQTGKATSAAEARIAPGQEEKSLPEPTAPKEEIPEGRTYDHFQTGSPSLDLMAYRGGSKGVWPAKLEAVKEEENDKDPALLSAISETAQALFPALEEGLSAGGLEVHAGTLQTEPCEVEEPDWSRDSSEAEVLDSTPGELKVEKRERSRSPPPRTKSQGDKRPRPLLRELPKRNVKAASVRYSWGRAISFFCKKCDKLMSSPGEV